MFHEDNDVAIAWVQIMIIALVVVTAAGTWSCRRKDRSEQTVPTAPSAVGYSELIGKGSRHTLGRAERK